MFSNHADAQLISDGLNQYDAIESVLNAQQWYKKVLENGEMKYIFISPTYDDVWVYSAGKIVTDKDTLKENYFFYITAKKAD